jgi:2-polyprenyl-6-methoxyphenol hydroxylase-like FAD-dependent oxidoreductase
LIRNTGIIMISKSFADFVPPSRLPVGLRFDHMKGVTALGDAAHLMTPFAGIGVNTAFWDAMLLSDYISKYSRTDNEHDLDYFIVGYEEKMWANAKKAQQLTYDTLKDMLLNPNAPRRTIESWVCRHMKSEMSAWLYPFGAAAVYVGYFLYKLFV